MLILTESNNPFKEQELGFHMPEALQEMMEESGLSFELFDEEFAFSDNNTYLFAMLYEAECAWNEIWGSMVKSEIQIRLNEAPAAQQNSTGFWVSLGQFIQKIWTGIKNFFKRVWAAITNNQKLFMDASKNVDPAKQYDIDLDLTYDEIIKHAQIIKNYKTAIANAKTAYDSSLDAATFNKAYADAERAYNTEMNNLAKQVQDRHKIEAKINGTELQKYMQGSHKVIAGLLKELEAATDTEVKNLQRTATKGKSKAQKKDAVKSNPNQTNPTGSIPPPTAEVNQTAPTASQTSSGGDQSADDTKEKEKAEIEKRIITLLSKLSAEGSKYLNSVNNTLNKIIQMLKSSSQQDNQNTNAQQQQQANVNAQGQPVQQQTQQPAQNAQ